MIDRRLQEIFAGNEPIFFLLAGPNGAGKSTFRKTYLDPLGFACIDPDALARELFGRDPRTKEESKEATLAATARVRELLQTGLSAGLETVFSDGSGFKLQLLEEARALDYRVGVIFIGVNNSQLSIARVMDRVDEGGHDVPDEMVCERFPKSFGNLRRAMGVCDFLLLIDNSSEAGHRLFGVATRASGIEITGTPPDWYSRYVAQ